MAEKSNEPDNCFSGQALNHWDFDAFCATLDHLSELGFKVYRLSIEWSKVEPISGFYSPEVLAHYRRMLKAIRQHNMKVVLTLWHTSNPLWVARRGAWTRRRTVKDFKRYARVCIEALGDLVDYWTPINEIGAYAWYGYFTGQWAPGKKWRVVSYLKVVFNLIAAHHAAASIIAENPNHAPVGIAQANTTFKARPNNAPNRKLAELYRWWNDRFILDRVKGTLDFIGINHYFPMYVNFLPYPGNESEHETMYEVIMDAWRRYGLPIMITESGIDDPTDERRPDFLVRVLTQVHRAIQDGANVIGYLHWTPFDCFEWGSGWRPRFGLFALDIKTGRLAKRPSADLYAEIIRANALPD